MVVKVSLLVGGPEMKEATHHKHILSRIKWCQVLSSLIPIVHTGMGSSMDSHTMILPMSMGSSVVATVILLMGMGNNSTESLWYPRKCNNHHQMYILK